MTVIQRKHHNPTAHLSAQDVEDIGAELDAIRAEVIASRGERDAAYIRKVIDGQRKLEFEQPRRAAVFAVPAGLGRWAPPGCRSPRSSRTWRSATTSCTVSGTGCATPRSTRPPGSGTAPRRRQMWKHSHNELHHTYTNVLGKDNDLGYGIMRVDEDQRWKPFYLAQPLSNFLNACIFQYGIAIYDLEIGRLSEGQDRQGRVPAPGQAGARQDPSASAQGLRACTRCCRVHRPSPRWSANLTANLVRNLWTHSVIMCGHFPEGVQTFEKASIDGETRGQWYLRQMLGSANITGRPLMHIMTGNLSFQIEHHLFPDLPSNRYQEIAPKVQDLFERYGLDLHERSVADSRLPPRGRRSSDCRCPMTSRAGRQRHCRRPPSRVPSSGSRAFRPPPPSPGAPNHAAPRRAPQRCPVVARRV